MEDSRLVGTHMSIGHKLLKNGDSKEVDQTTYRSMIGKLKYVVHMRPNITLVVGMMARFSTNPKENHMIAIKRIMGYLKGIEDYGLWYKKGGKNSLKAFIDVD